MMFVESLVVLTEKSRRLFCHYIRPITSLSLVLGFGVSLGACVQTLDVTPVTSLSRTTHRLDAETFASGKAVGPVARTAITYPTVEKEGTLIVDVPQRRLFLVMAEGKAMSYGIGVARQGFEWSGTTYVSAKREWPGWTPPPQMRERERDLQHYMAGGLDNPLGARALYLGSTLYRIHGSNEPETIGSKVSSGCIRLANGDVMDLFERVKVGTRVIVIPEFPELVRLTASL